MSNDADRFHGEYKTPGGKLVAVDLQVVDGCLSDVQVSGDFFVYPEEAFADLARALEGASIDDDEAALADRVRREFRSGAELLGSSPEGVAIAVGRALAGQPEGRHG